jgi:hypothetical protein
MSILKLALYPPSRETPNSTDLAGQPFGNINRSSLVGHTLTSALRYTRCPEVHKYLDSLLAQPSAEEDLSHLLIFHARWGNLSMVRYLLDIGVSVDALSYFKRKTPLAAACQGGHEEVVDLLLERGANPNFEAENPRRRTALPKAASSGSLTMVRKLLDHGAHINEPVDFWERWPAIWWAVAIEHTAMIQLLLERGASLEGWIGETALEMSEELGLDSMAEMLLKLGIKVVEPIVNSGSAPWKKWPAYP